MPLTKAEAGAACKRVLRDKALGKLLLFVAKLSDEELTAALVDASDGDAAVVEYLSGLIADREAERAERQASGAAAGQSGAAEREAAAAEARHWSVAAAGSFNVAGQITMPTAEFQRLMDEAVERGVKRARMERTEGSSIGVARNSTVLMSVDGVNEDNAWREYVTNRVPCSIVDFGTLLPPPRFVLAALRWLVLMTCMAPHFKLAAHFNMKKLRNEVPWHAPLLLIYQAAAAGQQDVTFAKEEHARGDSAREDIRGLIRGVPRAPQEVKKAYVPSNSDSSGIEHNRAAFAKLLKVICAKFFTGNFHLVTFASRMEAIWVAAFDFATQSPGAEEQRQLQQAGAGQQQRTCRYDNLASVRVTPGFPQENVCADGILCKDLTQNLEALAGDADATLADLLLRAAAMPGWGMLPSERGEPTTQPPPGFVLLGCYVDALCINHNIQLAQPTTVFASSIGGATAGSSMDLSAATVVYLGTKSLVLRLPGQDCVLKVAPADAIKREVVIHAAARGLAHVRHLRDSGHGVIEGAGGGLGFVVLEGWGKPVPATQLRDASTLRSAWLQQMETAVDGLHRRGILHRDIKPSNFLILNSPQQQQKHDPMPGALPQQQQQQEATLVLNDFDLSCLKRDAGERSRQRVGTPKFWSPRFDVEQPRAPVEYCEDDDWMSLALSIAYWMLLERDRTASPAEAKMAVVHELLQRDCDIPPSLHARLQHVVERVERELLVAA